MSDPLHTIFVERWQNHIRRLLISHPAEREMKFLVGEAASHAVQEVVDTGVITQWGRVKNEFIQRMSISSVKDSENRHLSVIVSYPVSLLFPTENGGDSFRMMSAAGEDILRDASIQRPDLRTPLSGEAPTPRVPYDAYMQRRYPSRQSWAPSDTSGVVRLPANMFKEEELSEEPKGFGRKFNLGGDDEPSS